MPEIPWKYFENLYTLNYDIFSHLSQGFPMPMIQNINEDVASTSKETEPDHTMPVIVAECTSLMKKFANLKCIRGYVNSNILYYNKLGKMSRFTSNVMLFYIDSN